jgi:predicted ATPase
MIPSIQQVQIRNYKSIAQVSVNLETFTVFVGPNGSGKSNFIDALAFVQECLSESIELAFKNRGGIAAVRRSSTGHPTHIGIRLALNLSDELFADYAFEIAAKPKEKFSVARERCVVHKFMGQSHSFEIENGKFTTEIPGIRPKMAADRLALFAASATDEFRPVYDFLTSMRFYSIVPVRLRELQEPDAGDFLKRDGSNAAAVLKRLQEEAQGNGQYDRVCRLLSRVVEGINKVEYRAIGQKETLQFRQDVGGSEHPWSFNALNMSDGTLRVLGLLLAVYQPGPYSVVAVEEPEATVNPAVAEVVVEVLMDAANEKQVLLTSHSPDILDYKDLTDNQIRVVAMDHGRTLIAPVSQAGRVAIQERLYTPGELLRSGELSPDLKAAEQAAQQLNLFGVPNFGRRHEA